MLVGTTLAYALSVAAFLPARHGVGPACDAASPFAATSALRCGGVIKLQQQPSREPAQPPPRSYVKGVPERMRLLLQDLAMAGATKVQVEEAFAEAVEQIFAPAKDDETLDPQPAVAMDGASAAAAKALLLGELKPPATATAGQEAFRAAYKKFKQPPVLSFTQKFLNTIIEDRACVFRFEYNAIYAVGFTALCDAFLRQSCKTPADEAATRSALCWALGLDEAQVAHDADALLSSAAGMSRDELFGTDTFATLARSSAARPHKYTYAFGVGLVLLMQTVGETKLSSRDGLKYGAKYKGAGGEPGAIELWCAALNLKFADTLDRDYVRPLSIDGIGRFSFENRETGLEDASAVLSSIGVQGNF